MCQVQSIQLRVKRLVHLTNRIYNHLPKNKNIIAQDDTTSIKKEKLKTFLVRKTYYSK